jgi:hypothetical protein
MPIHSFERIADRNHDVQWTGVSDPNSRFERLTS